MSFEEFQKLLVYIKEFRNPTWFDCESFCKKGRKVERVDCSVDFRSSKITQIRILVTDGTTKTFDVTKDLDAWTIQMWLVGTKS